MKTYSLNRWSRLGIGFLLLLGSMPALGVELKKEYTQTFPAHGNDLLQIDNVFGSITVTYWDRDEVKMAVEVRSESSSEQDAKKYLDRVEVRLAKNGKNISGITSLQEGECQGCQLRIDYYIQMPKKLQIALNQKYGNIQLPKNNKGLCILQVKYGNINGGDFSAPLTINCEYGNVMLGSTDQSALSLAYSDLKLERAEALDLKLEYGDMEIGRITKGELNLGYSDGEIGMLDQSLHINPLNFGDLEIKQVSADFQEIAVASNYGSLSLGIASSASFRIKADNMQFGACSVKGFPGVTEQEKESVRASINGGKGGSIVFDGGGFGSLEVKAR